MKHFDAGLLISAGLVAGTLVAALVTDIRAIDSTRGGYEPPYDDYTGEPINWHDLERTETGLLNRGYVLNTHVNGATGMISFSVLGMEWDYRPLSERAVAIHDPHEAFRERGFEPEF